MARLLLASFAVLSFVSCGPQQPKQEPLTAIHAYCQVRNNVAAIVCVDYAQGGATNSKACDDEVRKYAGRGAARSYYHDAGDGKTACSNEESGLAILGNCLLGNMTVKYYSTAWNTATAGDDCKARAGTWANP